VAQENVETVRRAFELWEASEFDALAALYDPAVSIFAPEDWPEPGPWHGREVAMEQFRTLQDGFSERSVFIDEIAAHGQWVVARYHIATRGQRSGIELRCDTPAPSVCALARSSNSASTPIMLTHSESLGFRSSHVGEPRPPTARK
jgi:hypothetical protein